MKEEILTLQQKVNLICGYQERLNIPVFLETGTFLGGMIKGVFPYFQKIFSIEINKNYFQKAFEKFKNTHVTIFLGDSTDVLPILMKRIKSPTFFWLDAHYWPNSPFAMGATACPIREELLAIAQHPLASNHVIFIDDYRCFVGRMNYPMQDELIQIIQFQFPNHAIEIQSDIIRVIPKHLSVASLGQ